MSDTVQIISAVFSFLGVVVTGYVAVLIAKLNFQTSQAAIQVAEVARKQDHAVAEVQAVKETLRVATIQTKDQLTAVVEKVEEVHKATNSITDQLVAKTEAEALARGGVEERARAEARKNQP